eukprot:GHVS01000081.1.p2 GENE.GHVS01000081.1~~GHVS01000081.1.p2  ORF type:complete len:118 (+),score=31.39 GHVS01000081.1:155-508(+)
MAAQNPPQIIYDVGAPPFMLSWTHAGYYSHTVQPSTPPPFESSHSALYPPPPAPLLQTPPPLQTPPLLQTPPHPVVDCRHHLTASATSPPPGIFFADPDVDEGFDPRARRPPQLTGG